MRYRFQDPVSGFTHLAGALLGVAGLTYLLSRSLPEGSLWKTLSFTVFGVSLILLYSSSALYHLLDITPEARLVFRRIDHTMIFLLIAGTYTPFCLLPLRGPWGYGILATVWALTLGGIVMSVVWIHAPRWLSTSLYLLTGWVAMAAIYPLSRTLSSPGMFWLLTGGFFYTAGAVIYGLKWPDPWPPRFGYHEIWHFFVLAGSASHFLSVATL
jgi:hemolysin III